MTLIKYPFEVPFEAVESDPDLYIDAVFDSLQSSFLVLPQGPGFVPYADFAEAYEVLKRYSDGFSRFEPTRVMVAIGEDALSLVVLRAILGFSPPEWAYTSTEGPVPHISQSFARAVDREVRENRRLMDSCTSLKRQRITVMVVAGCRLINDGGGESPEGMIHRLDKADTRQGQESVQHLANHGAPYAMLLYERFLGRPFASHRDSELVK